MFCSERRTASGFYDYLCPFFTAFCRFSPFFSFGREGEGLGTDRKDFCGPFGRGASSCTWNGRQLKFLVYLRIRSENKQISEKLKSLRSVARKTSRHCAKMEKRQNEGIVGKSPS